MASVDLVVGPVVGVDGVGDDPVVDERDETQVEPRSFRPEPFLPPFPGHAGRSPVIAERLDAHQAGLFGSLWMPPLDREPVGDGLGNRGGQ